MLPKLHLVGSLYNILIFALRNFAGGPKNPRHVGRSCINIDVFDFDTEICIDVSVSEESRL